MCVCVCVCIYVAHCRYCVFLDELVLHLSLLCFFCKPLKAHTFTTPPIYIYIYIYCHLQTDDVSQLFSVARRAGRLIETHPTLR